MGRAILLIVEALLVLALVFGTIWLTGWTWAAMQRYRDERRAQKQVEKARRAEASSGNLDSRERAALFRRHRRLP